MNAPVIHSAEEQYLTILREILQVAKETGVDPDRTGTGRVRVFARDIRVNLSGGILPCITTRKVNYEHAIEELLWMIRGSSNIKDLADNTKVIWKNWAVTETDIDAFIEKFFGKFEKNAKDHVRDEMKKRQVGSIGPMYGQFWRNNPSISNSGLLPVDSLLMEDIPSDKLKRYQEEYDEMAFFEQQSNPDKNKEEILASMPPFEYVAKMKYFNSNDQLGEIVRGIKRRPFSARHVMSAWIPQAVPFEGALSPQENVLIGRGALSACHVLSQFFVEKAMDGGPNWLSLRIVQRSCDTAIGVCTNLNFYGLLLHLVAHVTGLRSKELIWSGGDVHLYSNHLENAAIQVERTPLPPPTITINPEAMDLFKISRGDIEVHNYQHLGPLKYEVS